MKSYAVRLYNKDETNLIAVVEANNKKEARKNIQGEWGRKYKLGQIFFTDLPVGIHQIEAKKVCSPHVRAPQYEQQLEALNFFLQQQEDKRRQEWERKYPDGESWESTTVGLPKKLIWKPVRPGEKWDLSYRRITRKHWKRLRKEMEHKTTT